IDGQGNISIRRVIDDQEVAQLLGPGEPAWIILFSPNGQYLAAKYHDSERRHLNQCWVWDWRRQKKVLIISQPMTGLEFSPDSRWLAVGFPKGTVNVYDLTSAKKEVIGWPQGPFSGAFAVHPDRHQPGTSGNDGIQLCGEKAINAGHT